MRYSQCSNKLLIFPGHLWCVELTIFSQIRELVGLSSMGINSADGISDRIGVNDQLKVCTKKKKDFLFLWFWKKWKRLKTDWRWLTVSDALQRTNSIDLRFEFLWHWSHDTHLCVRALGPAKNLALQSQGRCKKPSTYWRSIFQWGGAGSPLFDRIREFHARSVNLIIQGWGGGRWNPLPSAAADTILMVEVSMALWLSEIYSIRGDKALDVWNIRQLTVLIKSWMGDGSLY